MAGLEEGLAFEELSTQGLKPRDEKCNTANFDDENA